MRLLTRIDGIYTRLLENFNAFAMVGELRGSKQKVR